MILLKLSHATFKILMCAMLLDCTELVVIMDHKFANMSVLKSNLFAIDKIEQKKSNPLNIWLCTKYSRAINSETDKVGI